MIRGVLNDKKGALCRLLSGGNGIKRLDDKVIQAKTTQVKRALMGMGKEKPDGADGQSVGTLHMEEEAAVWRGVDGSDGAIHPSMDVQASDAKRAIKDRLAEIEQKSRSTHVSYQIQTKVIPFFWDWNNQ